LRVFNAHPEQLGLPIGTNAGFAALPNLTSPVFDLATVNGQPAI
jgi:hypothetical protein